MGIFKDLSILVTNLQIQMDLPTVSFPHYSAAIAIFLLILTLVLQLEQAQCLRSWSFHSRLVILYFLQPRQVLCGMQNIAPIWQAISTALLSEVNHYLPLLHCTTHTQVSAEHNPHLLPRIMSRRTLQVANYEPCLVPILLSAGRTRKGGNHPQQLGQCRKSRCLQSFAQLRLPKNFYKWVYGKEKNLQTRLHVSKDNVIVPGSI